MSHRIHILGGSGTGTSTLGRGLAQRLDIPWYDVDDFYWHSDPPYARSRPVPERLALLGRALDASASWTLSGSLVSWAETIVDRFTLVVYLTVPQAERLRRLGEREAARFGREAVEPGGWFHENHRTFIEWAALYDDGDPTVRSRRRHEMWLSTLRCSVLRLDGVKSPDELVETVMVALEARGR